MCKNAYLPRRGGTFLQNGVLVKAKCVPFWGKKAPPKTPPPTNGRPPELLGAESLQQCEGGVWGGWSKIVVPQP